MGPGIQCPALSELDLTYVRKIRLESIKKCFLCQDVTVVCGNQGSKVFGIVTNMDWDGNELIRWLHQRCGKSEEAHSVMKDDLAGGKLPSNDFGENAAWWWIMILALNLNAAMKRLVLGQSWVPKRMKAIRFALINLAAQVVDSSRYLPVRLSKGHRSLKWLLNIQAKIAMLSPVPSR